MSDKKQLCVIKEARKRILAEEDLQKKYIFLYSFDKLGYLDWLIEQAEKVERYKQALVEISNADWNLEGLDAERELDRVTDIAFIALEGEE